MHNRVMTIMSVGDSAQVVPSGSDAHPRKPVPALGCFPPATDRAAPLFFALTYNLVSSSLLICVICLNSPFLCTYVQFVLLIFAHSVICLNFPFLCTCMQYFPLIFSLFIELPFLLHARRYNLFTSSFLCTITL